MIMSNFDRMIDAADSVYLMCDSIRELLSYINATINTISDRADLILSLDEDDYNFTDYSTAEVDVETKLLTADLSKSNSKLQKALFDLSKVSKEFSNVWNILEKHDRSVLL